MVAHSHSVAVCFLFPEHLWTWFSCKHVSCEWSFVFGLHSNVCCACSQVLFTCHGRMSCCSFASFSHVARQSQTVIPHHICIEVRHEFHEFQLCYFTLYVAVILALLLLTVASVLGDGLGFGVLGDGFRVSVWSFVFCAHVY